MRPAIVLFAVAAAAACGTAAPLPAPGDVAADKGAVGDAPADTATSGLAGADSGSADGFAEATSNEVSPQDAAEAAANPCNVKPTLASLEKDYFAASCAFGSCHSAAKHAGELVLEQGKSYAQLVGVQALHPGAAGFVRVEPGKPNDSFLVVKVTQPQPGQGKLMPVGATEPIDADCGIAALKAWIAAGAPK
ncbi:MAG: hypothetical protein FJ100_14365 [Deltaproteobacteria bacterium]|nr:hypothetical protein [Deltaproteobacteria bacterium]